MKALSQKNIVEWILEARSAFSTEYIVNSFKSCGLNLQIDGTEDHVIHCLKEGEPCASGKDKLKSQQSVLSIRGSRSQKSFYHEFRRGF